MSNYTKSTNFAAKDSLPSGNASKIVKGTEIDTEFNNIATAVATKTDNASAAITGGTITGITDLAVADGGTGSSTASGARSNLGAAASGANSDITSLTGLTTALSVAQGGTGSTTASGARTSLGVAIGTDVLAYVAPGTSGNVLTSNGSAWTSSTPTGATPDVKTFNSSGTWTKPTGAYTMAMIEVWGAGGGGSRSNQTAKSGSGAGGGFLSVIVPLSYLASSVSVTVGSGGTGATTNAAGGNGGTSSVPLNTAWNGLSSVSASGGTGGSTVCICGPEGAGGSGGQPFSLSATGSPFSGGNGVGSSGGAGAASFYGGGGGGRGANGGNFSGGVSGYGGTGGIGFRDANGGDGAQPGGGGGASYTANYNGGNGAAGRVVITSY